MKVYIKNNIIYKLEVLIIKYLHNLRLIKICKNNLFYNSLIIKYFCFCTGRYLKTTLAITCKFYSTVLSVKTPICKLVFIGHSE